MNCEAFAGKPEFLEPCQPRQRYLSQDELLFQFVTGVFSGAGKGWISWAEKTGETFAKKNLFFSSCGMPCKREWAYQMPKYRNLTNLEIDRAIEKIPPVELYHQLLYDIRAEDRLEQSMAAINYDPVRDPRAGQKSQSKREMSVDLDPAFEAAKKLISTNYEKLQVCINPEKMTEFLAYRTYASVLTPDAVVGASIAKNINSFLKVERKTQASTSGLRRLEHDLAIEANLDRSFTTVEQNRTFIKAAQDVTPEKGWKFLVSENSVLKKLNDSIQDKDLVTSLTNKHKELFLEQIENLKKVYGNDIDFLPYSDFKSIQFAFKPKNGKTIPPEFKNSLEKAFAQANKKFEAHLSVNHIVRKSDHADEWFRAGFSETADQASFAARQARDIPGANALRDYSSAAVQKRLDSVIPEIETNRQYLSRKWSQTPLLEKTESGVVIPKSDVFNILRKNDDVPEIREALVKKFGGSDLQSQEAFRNKLTDESILTLQDYGKMVDEFSPSLRVEERKIASLASAEHGGASMDASGMGGVNLRGTAEALAKSKNGPDAIKNSRLAEESITRQFQDDMGQAREKFQKYFEQPSSTGDDTVANAVRPLKDREKQEFLQDISTLPNPGRKRISFLAEGAAKSERNAIATHGESIEKTLRQNLEGQIDKEKLDNLLFGIDMKGKSAGRGDVGLLLGNSRGVSLTSTELSTIKRELKNAVRDVNKDLSAEGNFSGRYKASP